MAMIDMPPQDLQLTLQGVIAGNADAQNKLCRFYRAQIFRYPRTLFSNDEDADEVTQDALVALLENPVGFLGHSKLSTYLCAIAKNKAADLWRRSSAKRVYTDIDGDDESLNIPDESRSSNPELAVGDALTEARYRKCLEKLPFEQREVFGMSYELHIKQVEIA
jgi:RNA polymerase sigma-70 factor (ECF subfamily)